MNALLLLVTDCCQDLQKYANNYLIACDDKPVDNKPVINKPTLNFLETAL